jgi:hypothetical protein
MAPRGHSKNWRWRPYKQVSTLRPKKPTSPRNKISEPTPRRRELREEKSQKMPSSYSRYIFHSQAALKNPGESHTGSPDPSKWRGVFLQGLIRHNAPWLPAFSKFQFSNLHQQAKYPKWEYRQARYPKGYFYNPTITDGNAPASFFTEKPKIPSVMPIIKIEL